MVDNQEAAPAGFRDFDAFCEHLAAPLRTDTAGIAGKVRVAAGAVLGVLLRVRGDRVAPRGEPRALRG